MKKSWFIFLILILAVGSVDTLSISLNGKDNMTVEVGSIYNDSGIILSNIGSSITISSDLNDTNPNTNIIGIYTTTYTSTDSSNITIIITRTINVIDTTAPNISLNEPNPQMITQNNPYIELGATVIDNSREVISPIIDTSNVNVNIIGNYTVIYTATDSSGNIATATRVVRVIESVPSDDNDNQGNNGGNRGGNSKGNSKFSNPKITSNVVSENEEVVTESNNSKNQEVSSKAGITGKSISELIIQNKGTSIIVGILVIGAIVGYYFFPKKKIKRKLYG